MRQTKVQCGRNAHRVSSWKADQIPLTLSLVLSTFGLLIGVILAPELSRRSLTFWAIEEGSSDLTQISLLLPFTGPENMSARA